MSSFEENPHNPSEETIDWTAVPQTTEEYLEFTGVARHALIPNDDPRRPDYHGKGLLLPKVLPVAGKLERKALRQVAEFRSEKDRHTVAEFVIEHFGEQILDEIMAATYDGKITPQNVFGFRLREEWIKENSGTTITRHDVITQPPLVTEEDSRSPWYRNKNYLAVAGFSAAIGLMGVMMLPIFPAPPEAGPQTDPPVTDTER